MGEECIIPLQILFDLKGINSQGGHLKQASQIIFHLLTRIWEMKKKIYTHFSSPGELVNMRRPSGKMENTMLTQSTLLYIENWKYVAHTVIFGS